MTKVEKLQKELIEQVSEKVKELQKTEQTYIPHQFSEEEKEDLLPREEEQYLFNKIKEKILNHFDLNKHNPQEVYDYMKSMRDDFETEEIEWDYVNYKYTPYLKEQDIPTKCNLFISEATYNQFCHNGRYKQQRDFYYR